MTAPLLSAIPLPWSAASEQAAEVTWITQHSNCVQLGYDCMMTLQQDVVRHMKVTVRVAGVPTVQCPLIGELHSHAVVPPCRASYDRLALTMCLCPVALSCSRCDIVNPTLQIRRI